jgi:hypothetical protein
MEIDLLAYEIAFPSKHGVQTSYISPPPKPKLQMTYIL